MNSGKLYGARRVQLAPEPPAAGQSPQQRRRLAAVHARTAVGRLIPELQAHIAWVHRRHAGPYVHDRAGVPTPTADEPCFDAAYALAAVATELASFGSGGRIDAPSLMAALDRFRRRYDAIGLAPREPKSATDIFALRLENAVEDVLGTLADAPASP